MIHFVDISKTYHVEGVTRTVLRPTSMSLPTHRRIGLLGRNGSGKTTLLKMIAGVEMPDQGRIIRHARVSWPLGFGVGLQTDMTGAENVSFACSINAADYESVIAFVEDFAELGDYLHLPVRLYSQGMRARLSFGMCLGIQFDCYLIDEVLSVGDSRFRERSKYFLTERFKSSGLILVSHNEQNIKQYCDTALVLKGGQITPFFDISEALHFYKVGPE